VNASWYACSPAACCLSCTAGAWRVQRAARAQAGKSWAGGCSARAQRWAWGRSQLPPPPPPPPR
jgi:hypothetical protein